MNRPLAYGILVVFAALSIALAAAKPEWVSDNNKFLAGFVTHELLGLLGVILAITLASISSVHLEFNKIEERHKKRGLTKSRKNLMKAAYWLIALFVAAVGLVVLKPLVCSSPAGEAIVNMLALLIVLWHVLILISLTQLIFAIEPEIEP